MELILKEGDATVVGPTDIPDHLLLALAHSKYVKFDWGGPHNGFKHSVTANGWIGHLSFSPTFLIRIEPKVSIRNIFELLEVAYNLKSFRLFDGQIQVETLEGLIGRLASILARRVNDRARRGLHGGYKQESSALPSVRGRIDAPTTIRKFLRGSVALECVYDEHNRDVEDNRILLWTLHQVSRMSGLNSKIRNEVSGSYRALHGLVTLEECNAKNCVGRPYSRLNEDYRPMHGLCRLLLDSLEPGHSAGEYTFIPFALYMPNLFESFLASWLSAKLPHIKVHIQHHSAINSSAKIEVRIDIVLADIVSGKKIAVLDSKYKNVTEPSMADIQQVAFYANEMNVEHAFLVYPSSEAKSLWVRNGRVTIETLVFDLACPPTLAGEAFLQDLRTKLPQISAVRPN